MIPVSEHLYQVEEAIGNDDLQYRNDDVYSLAVEEGLNDLYQKSSICFSWMALAVLGYEEL